MSIEEISSGNISVNVSDTWPVQATGYNLNCKIGKGAFATVYKALTQTDFSSQSRPCAIKIINLEHVDTNFVDIRQEVQTMRLFSHSNILSCYTSFLHHTNLWLVMQLMDKGSSSRCLSNARILYNPLNNNGLKQNWDIEGHITYILHQTILGLKYIHDNSQIHRDIKAGNVLLNSKGDVKIADFGVSGWLVQGGAHRENTRTFVGTPCWMAPEVMEQVHGYDTKADLWSLGITALELAFGYAPYAKYPPMKVLLKTIQEDPPSFHTYDNDDDEWLHPQGRSGSWSDSFRDMTSWCLQKNPKNRPNCDELLAHKHLLLLQDVSILAEYKRKIKEEILDKISDVGTEETDNVGIYSANLNHGADKSDIPITIVTESNDDTRRTAWVFPEISEKRPSGTTWIFSDGSNISVSADEALGRKDKEVTQSDFFDQFEKETQGEHFKHPSRRNSTQNSSKVRENSNDLQNTSSSEDDINAFMDHFEQETGGEDFRKSRNID